MRVHDNMIFAFAWLSKEDLPWEAQAVCVQETGRLSGAGGSVVTGTPRRGVPAGPGELAGLALGIRALARGP